MAKTKIDLEGKDNASRAFQTATERLAQLRAEISRLKSTDITVGDARKLNALTSEAGRLEKALLSTGTTGVQSASQMSGAFGGLQKTLSGLGLGGLAQFAGPAGIGLALAGVGKLTLGLNAMREESAQVEARFVGFTGGTGQATEALAAMDAELGNALTRDEKMAAATQLLGLDIAKTAQEAASLTKQAMILGLSTETLTQALETGRVNGLVQYGISVTDVASRVKELQRADADLTDIEAKAIAIKEQLAAKAQLVADAGGQAATGMQTLKNAWSDLLDTTADTVNLSAGVSALTSNIQALTGIISGQGKQAGDGPLSLLERIANNTGPQAALRDATEGYAAALAVAATWQGKYNEVLASGDAAAINFAGGQLAMARAAADVAGADLEAAKATAGLTTARQLAAEAAGAGITSELDYVAATDAATAADLRAAAAASGKTAARSMANLETMGVGAYEDYIGPGQYEANKAAANRRIEAERAEVAAATNKNVASDYQRQMIAAGKAAATEIQGYLQKGANFSINLSDQRGANGGDPFAPGANGPFENIYRLQAWIQDGSWAETAAQLGIQSKEAAAQIVKAFQMGNITPGVEGAIDMGQLVNLAQLEQAAQANYSAFASKVAGLAGTDAQTATKVLSGVFGGAGLGTEGGTNEAAQTAAGAALRGFVGELKIQVKDYAGEMVGFGSMLFGSFGKGFVDEARQSDTLKRAIDAMVVDAIGRHLPTSGSTSGAAKAAGASGL